MTLEKFSPEDIEKFFATTGKFENKPAPADPPPAAAAPNPKFAKYAVMRKNLPEGGVLMQLHLSNFASALLLLFPLLSLLSTSKLRDHCLLV